MPPTPPAGFAAAHLLRPDVTGEPGYRPRCLECGRERAGHPIPSPRTPTRQQDDTEEQR